VVKVKLLGNKKTGTLDHHETKIEGNFTVVPDTPLRILYGSRD